MTTNKAFSAPCGGTVGRIQGHRGFWGGRVGSGLGPIEPWMYETASLTLFWCAGREEIQPVGEKRKFTLFSRCGTIRGTTRVW